VLAIGNDRQFKDWCDLVGAPGLATKYPTNADRVTHREVLEIEIETHMKRRTRQEWDRELHKRGIPGGPVNSIREVFEHPQSRHRNVRVQMSSPTSRIPIPVIANPIKFSESPVSYSKSPPSLGEQTDEILENLLGINEAERVDLRNQNIIR